VVSFTPSSCLTAPQSCNCPSLSQLHRGTVELADFCASHAAEIDHSGALPLQEFERLTQVGLLAAPLPTGLGGVGLGMDTATTNDLLMVLQQLGRGNLAVGRIYEGHVNALQLIQTFGSPEQIATYAADARDRHKIFGVWNAEDEGGVTIQSLSNGRYRLNGCKTFCSGSGLVERPFVSGPLDGGLWQLCIVPMEEVATVSDPSWWQPSGMRASASFKVDFTGVELPASALIGQPGDYFRQPWLTAGVVRFAAVQLGGAEALFNATRHYLQALGRTTDPYQQERLGRMAIALESGNLWLRGAAEVIHAYAPIFGGSADPNEAAANPGQTAKLVAYANMVRTAIEQICMDMIQLGERSVGTRGLLPPHPMDRIIRDLTLYLRQPVFDAALAHVGQQVLSETSV
jgi:alkylation response protein AidB-like acyl-CoA dehydrogenase